MTWGINRFGEAYVELGGRLARLTIRWSSYPDWAFVFRRYDDGAASCLCLWRLFIEVWLPY